MAARIDGQFDTPRRPAFRNGAAPCQTPLMNILEKLVWLAAAIVVLCPTVPAGAQTAAQSAALEKKLLAAKRLECKFSTLATGDWAGANTKASVSTSMLEIAFAEIDIDEGTAESEAGFGESFISVKYAHGYLHFMQISDAGPLYLTTVLVTETTPGRFKAIHSRHEWSPAVVPGFTSRPELYVGDCAAKT
jgi:hypothetical protein